MIFCRFILLIALPFSASLHAVDMYVIPKPLSEECDKHDIYNVSKGSVTKDQAACITQVSNLILEYIKLAPVMWNSKSYLPNETANSVRAEIKKNIGYYNSIMDSVNEGQLKVDVSLILGKEE